MTVVAVVVLCQRSTSPVTVAVNGPASAPAIPPPSGVWNRIGVRGRLLDQTGLLHQVGEGQGAKTHAAARKHLAASDGVGIDVRIHWLLLVDKHKLVRRHQRLGIALPIRFDIVTRLDELLAEDGALADAIEVP